MFRRMLGLGRALSLACAVGCSSSDGADGESDDVPSDDGSGGADAGAVGPAGETDGDASAPQGPAGDDGAAADDGTSGTGPRPTIADGPDRELTPIEAPEATGCIDDVSAGDHAYSCNGLTFLTMVDPQCLEGACGMIVDVHGGTMAGAQMRDNTELHVLAPPQGYIVVHPSATSSNTGGFWTAERYPDVLDFMQQVIEVFQVDDRRIHFTGFSQGGAMSWWFLCNHSDLLASAAPTAAAGSCIQEGWEPTVSIMYMNGETDAASSFSTAQATMERLRGQLEMGDGNELAGDDGYTHTRFSNDSGIDLEFVEHNYGGQVVLAGHCIPGGIDIAGAANNFTLNATTCTTGDINFHWGEMVLQFFVAHPKP